MSNSASPSPLHSALSGELGSKAARFSCHGTPRLSLTYRSAVPYRGTRHLLNRPSMSVGTTLTCSDGPRYVRMPLSTKQVHAPRTRNCPSCCPAGAIRTENWSAQGAARNDLGGRLSTAGVCAGTVRRCFPGINTLARAASVWEFTRLVRNRHSRSSLHTPTSEM